MILKYQSGEVIKDHDRVLFHREAAAIEFVACDPGNPETNWYLQEFGGGVMIKASDYYFIPARQLDEYEDLEFVSRADLR
jgi:hypothetical protein